MSNKGSFYWHDYETFGTDPARDRPAQFAGIRTDFDFNEIGEPLEVYCRSANDFLPHPDACLITGITPQDAINKGVVEAEFIKKIHAELMQPNTCVVGYNSLRFDDEVTRNTLYRNFYDPYEREWRNGNSRWDLIDMVRLTRALRPEGIRWPDHPDGKPNFKLEQLTAANGIVHAQAHDAVSDVRATIEMAKLIKQKQPRLFDYVYSFRDKKKLQAKLNPELAQPVIHVSGMYPAEKGCLAIILPIVCHPTNKNAVAVYDLSQQPSDLIDLSAEDIYRRIFTKVSDLKSGEMRIPLKLVHVNRCPIVVPLNTLRPADAERLSIDVESCMVNSTVIQNNIRTISAKVAEAFNQDYTDAPTDPDLMLYSGGFFSAHDKGLMQQIRRTSVAELSELHPTFDDVRLSAMLFRYRARNYLDSLSDTERGRWDEYRMKRIVGDDLATNLSNADFTARITELEQSEGLSERNKSILSNLKEYEKQLVTGC